MSYYGRLGKSLKFAQAKYISLLHTRPVITKAATSGVLYFISDSISQYIENLQHEKEKRKPFQLDRALRMATFGFCMTGPVFHYWYLILDTKFPKKKTSHVLMKSALDQIICAPIFDAIFFIGMGVLERKSWEQIKEKLKKDWLYTYLVDCSVWPFFNIFSFKYIPNNQRVTVMNLFNISWTAFLAYTNNSH
ncbi:pmp22 family protein [Tieghemostelium lacteum]|uniref:Pmp22 family protein n=1 Tax=Tieghemostelium lacteum TaxID=361077 RepID=A0A151ZCT2_TIELA|nr:pmp22 family protein [Tieghemostelium lacteum]|eukprot:KYQ91758.1 pmp22 family protein [Tieghemostelium lacteum]